MPTPKVALVVISDRGELYLPRCLDAINAIGFRFYQHIIFEDPTHHYDQNQAVIEAWAQVDEGVDFVLHVEEDFVLHDAPIEEMAAILTANPDLAQLLLKRQPWGSVEEQAGGYIECFPDSYEDCDGFLKHQRFFSLNPCLIPYSVIKMGWQGSEGDQTTVCVERGLSFGIYGKREDEPRVTHVGDVRR